MPRRQGLRRRRIPLRADFDQWRDGPDRSRIKAKKNLREETMSQTIARESIRVGGGAALSRRALLGAGAGLVGAAALAGEARAQAPAEQPNMPASQAPVRVDW